jgi:hypothetical protein
MTQMGLFEALKKKDEGIKEVSGKNSFITGLLRIKAKEISRRVGEVCSDDLRAYADAEGLTVTTPEAWGAMVNGIFREKGWQLIGRKQSEIVSNHGREIKVWRWQ